MIEDEQQIEPPAAAEPAVAAAPRAPTQVHLKTPEGADSGVTVTLGPAPGEPPEDDETGRKALAARVSDWSAMMIDGAPYPHSPENALALVNRFPWFREQIAAAAQGEEA